MSSTTPITSPIKATPNAPIKPPKVEKAVKEKVVKEKVVKEKVVKEKAVKEKAVKEKAVKEKAVKEKAVKEKAVKENAVNENAVEDKPIVEKKARAPTLPAKQGKFIQYSYYLIRAINNAALETGGSVLIDEDAFIAAAHIFDTVEVQQTFVNGFLENKSIAKEMRTHLADKKKAAIALEKASKKAQQLAVKEAEKLAKLETKKATKSTTTKSKKQTNKAEPDLVTSLVTLANSKEDSVTVAETVEEEEEELDVKLFRIDGKEYLIDDNSNLYDINTHDVIGVFNQLTNTIVYP
jgi:hypothetical protein